MPEDFYKSGNAGNLLFAGDYYNYLITSNKTGFFNSKYIEVI